MNAATTAIAIKPSATRDRTTRFALERIQSSVRRSCWDVSPIRSLSNQFLLTIFPPFPDPSQTCCRNGHAQWRVLAPGKLAR